VTQSCGRRRLGKRHQVIQCAASAWACSAAPGDRVGVLSDGADYATPLDTDWQLIIGDEAATPAVASIVESLSPLTTATVLLEVADSSDELQIQLPADVTLSWLHRESGESALASLRDLAFPDGVPYVWVAGESTLATSVRRYLVNERGIAKDRIYFCGYWRRGEGYYT
jgi:NADPH-dependent ferric siderophore reductase